jgi:hypothetical protein
MKAFSNNHSGLSLDVDVMPIWEEGSGPVLSITSRHFHNPQVVELIRGAEQQLVYLQAVFAEYASSQETLPGEKLRMAEFLERMAKLIRRTAPSEST